MRIGELAWRAGVTTRAIRHHERIGVLPPAERTESGHRDFGDDALARLAFVRAAGEVGMTVGEIREVIAYRDRGESPCAHVLGLLERRSVGLAPDQGDAGAARRARGARRRARTLDPADCSDDDVCHIVNRSVPG